MQLYIHYANLEQLQKSYKDIFETKTAEEVLKFLKDLKYKNQDISFQYEVLYDAVSILKDPKYFWQSIASNVRWFYFGNDTCEYLIPTLKEMNDFFQEVIKLNKWSQSSFKKTMTLVTPPVWKFWIQRLTELFDYLENEVRENTEVVVNDLWVLNLINKNYKKLIPIMGRMLNKAQRNPLVWHDPDPQVPSYLGKEIYEHIKKQQYKYYDSNPIWLDVFVKSFQKYWIQRFWFDYAWYGLNESIETWAVLDIYYPYVSIAHGRNCATAWIVDKTREYYVSDIPCPRYCQKFDILYGAGINEKWITQRWNWVWMKYLSLERVHDSVIENDNHRMIFQPFISV